MGGVDSMWSMYQSSRYVWDECNPPLCKCQGVDGKRMDKRISEDDLQDKQYEDKYEDRYEGVCHELDRLEVTKDDMDGKKDEDGMQNLIMGIEDVRIVDEDGCYDSTEYDDHSEDGKQVFEEYAALQDSQECAIQGGGTKRCTFDFLRTLRRMKWEERIDWEEEDLERMVDSRDALEEDLQDFSIPMVIIGGDVVSLYPNLDVDIVVDRIRDEILRTDLEFNNVDYLEATRYLVLNWTIEQARNSNLRRVLPVRRKNRGTKPGIRGEGPRGSQRGDQEQWQFKENIILDDWERRQIVAEVVKIATEAMFKKHYYSFGGRTYHQRGGGSHRITRDLCSCKGDNATV